MFKHDRHLAHAKGLIVRMITAAATGVDRETFVEQEVRRMTCEWCELGIPLENGNHVLLGVTIPCEYEKE
jgi:hypothetical protein